MDEILYKKKKYMAKQDMLHILLSKIEIMKNEIQNSQKQTLNNRSTREKRKWLKFNN